jgi:3-hydroxyacyl-CoA dehydrogenase/enoyl-CoA hydratase/3-hydroxybutyryl-CoA epimerase
MGAAIAGTAVLNAEVEARLKDSELPRVGKGLKAALSILDERLKRRRLTRPQYQRLSGLLSGTADYSGFTRADLVIEAVFEDLAVKRQVLSEVEGEIRPEAIRHQHPPPDVTSRPRQRPEGSPHFFSPVERMPQPEVIPTDQTNAGHRAVGPVRPRHGKTVIVVWDHPAWQNGFSLPTSTQPPFSSKKVCRWS